MMCLKRITAGHSDHTPQSSTDCPWHIHTNYTPDTPLITLRACHRTSHVWQVYSFVHHNVLDPSVVMVWGQLIATIHSQWRLSFTPLLCTIEHMINTQLNLPPPPPPPPTHCFMGKKHVPSAGYVVWDVMLLKWDKASLLLLLVHTCYLVLESKNTAHD